MPLSYIVVYCLAGNFNLFQSSMIQVLWPCWISSHEPYYGMWHLSENGKHRGQFDAIVIAHNGNIYIQTPFECAHPDASYILDIQ